jgi:hypothetical protein
MGWRGLLGVMVVLVSLSRLARRRSIDDMPVDPLRRQRRRLERSYQLS